jgi:hypothetical protein
MQQGQGNKFHIVKVGEKLRIIDADGDFYEIDGRTPARNCFGHLTGMTVMEEFEAGNLFVVDDDITGQSYGMHAAVYAG